MTEIQVHKLIKLLEKLKKDTEGHELNWGETSDLRDLSRGMFNIEEVLDVLRFGELIEYHLRNGKSRILVRGNRTYYKYIPCIVFEIKTGKVITLYWNNEDDNHRTIDMSKYNEDMNVKETFVQSA